MRACSGVWVAHGSGTADRETVDRNDHVAVPPGEESYHIRRVWLSEEELQGYYYGFSNEGLWPLCHVAHTRPIFRAEDWRQYQAVNQKFADAVCSEADSDDPIILVQDYHFALAPAMIRKRLPAATVIVFWHIPWPNAERMGICPWRNELLEGCLAAASWVSTRSSTATISSIPWIGIWKHELIASITPWSCRGVGRWSGRIRLPWSGPSDGSRLLQAPRSAAQQVWRELGLKPNALLGVGVDRLDYTKGVEDRLLAVELLLERYPEFRGRFSFAQLAAPSRTKIDRYRELNETVERLAERINQRFGNNGYRPIILLRSHHEPPEVFRFLRAADLCYVSSLHDGMNLVAKEFVAARTDLKGVLVLSEFTGAARELTEALIVNPYDLDASSDALAAALKMPAEEQQDRMRSMRSLLVQFNVYRWAGKMLVDAARLRNQGARRGAPGRPFEHCVGKLLVGFPDLLLEKHPIRPPAEAEESTGSSKAGESFFDELTSVETSAAFNHELGQGLKSRVAHPVHEPADQATPPHRPDRGLPAFGRGSSHELVGRSCQNREGPPFVGSARMPGIPDARDTHDRFVLKVNLEWRLVSPVLFHS